MPTTIRSLFELIIPLRKLIGSFRRQCRMGDGIYFWLPKFPLQHFIRVSFVITHWAFEHCPPFFSRWQQRDDAKYCLYWLYGASDTENKRKLVPRALAAAKCVFKLKERKKISKSFVKNRKRANARSNCRFHSLRTAFFFSFYLCDLWEILLTINGVSKISSIYLRNLIITVIMNEHRTNERTNERRNSSRFTKSKTICRLQSTFRSRGEKWNEKRRERWAHGNWTEDDV